MAKNFDKQPAAESATLCLSFGEFSLGRVLCQMFIVSEMCFYWWVTECDGPFSAVDRFSSSAEIYNDDWSRNIDVGVYGVHVFAPNQIAFYEYFGNSVEKKWWSTLLCTKRNPQALTAQRRWATEIVCRLSCREIIFINFVVYEVKSISFFVSSKRCKTKAIVLFLCKTFGAKKKNN